MGSSIKELNDLWGGAKFMFQLNNKLCRAGLGEGVSKTINTIETIVLIMATTITVDEKTKDRLTDYKFGNWTYDEVLNMLMDKVSIEDISSEHIEEHYRRLKDFKGVSKEDFKKELKKRLKKGS